MFTVGLEDYRSLHDIENETIFGTNTQATTIYWTGDYYRDGEINVNFDASLGYSVSLGKILNFGVNASYEDTKRERTNAFTCDPYTRMAGLKIEDSDKVYLAEDEQYLAVNMNIAKVPDNSPNNEDDFTGQTTMKTKWKFDVYHAFDHLNYQQNANISVTYDVLN